MFERVLTYVLVKILFRVRQNLAPVDMGIYSATTPSGRRYSDTRYDA